MKKKKTSWQTVPVIVPVTVDQAFTYRIKSGEAIEQGSVVRVPLGKREVIGAVWDCEVDKDIAPGKIREVLHVFPTPPLNEEIRRFVEWVANWTLSSPGMVLRMILRVPEALEPEKPIKGFRLTGVLPDRITPNQDKVYKLMEGGLAWSKKDIMKIAGVGPAVVERLVKNGILEIVDIPPKLESIHPITYSTGSEMTKEQKTVASKFTEVAKGGFSVSLLDGVTGAGKTRVYFEAIAEALRLGKQVLILVPEISLTAQFLDRFEKRFKVKPDAWHSEISKKNRIRIWRNVAAGRIPAVVGARSALFLPFSNLGLIVIDEEHDLSFKQFERVSYNARDMSIVKARIGDFPVILSSATPSIESRVNANQGRYNHFELKKRATGTELPSVETIDMRTAGPERGSWLAPKLVEAVDECLNSNAQSLLFLNRRGYAPLTLCKSCGHRFQCVNCSTWLVEHRFRNIILCHHCGYHEKKPEVCPECDSKDSMVACGPGVERVSEEVATRFPNARTLILSSDIGGGMERLKRELQTIVNGEVDIVIGTQIVAKGMNFPSLMLVGVVDADLGLSYGDLRASEKTYQLLAQVTGRAGRIHGKGKGILQTYAPEHPVIEAMISGDSESFYKTEIAVREQTGLPPFGRLAAVIVSATEQSIAEQFARAVARKAPVSKEVRVLGPVEAPLALIRGRYRFRLLVQAPRKLDLQAYMRKWMSRMPTTKGGVKMQIDIDPYIFT